MAKQGVYITLERISQSSRYHRWIYHNIEKFLSGAVCDIGSGLGDVAELFKSEKIQQIALVEPNDEMIEALTKKFSDDTKFRVIKGDIREHQSVVDVGLHSVDTVTCINVLEHIDDDVAALQLMSKLLRPDGRIVLMVPAMPFLYGTLDTHVGHCRRYTKKMMAQVAEKAGLGIEKQFYMNFWGIISWFLAGKVFCDKEFNQGACQKLDKLVPILEVLEKLIKPPIGQSLVCVAYKR